MPSSINEMYEIKTKNNLHIFEKIYVLNEQFLLDSTIKNNDYEILLIEDEKAGLQFFEKWYSKSDKKCISSESNAPLSIFEVEKRCYPAGIVEGIGGKESERGIEEAITRRQFLLALTKNVARMWHEEDKIGSLEVGKIANMAILDTDFLHDDIDKLPNAKVVATIVDGEVVYKA